MAPTTLTMKLGSLYVAYAPTIGVFSYGVCLDEAVNGLTDELRSRGVGETGDEKTPYAVR